MTSNQPSESGSFWKSKSGIAFCVFLAIAAVFLILEHRAHLWQWLPFVLLAACPLMHVFMHGGHSGHSHGAQPGPRHDHGQHGPKGQG